MEEYEKSISRLLTERERDRTNFEQEKAKLQEELQAANHHLTNTEAAFNDVHQKYERLKGVVSVYKNNEAVLKESIQENVDTIKTLETRYDQLKEHAMTQLEKYAIDTHYQYIISHETDKSLLIKIYIYILISYFFLELIWSWTEYESKTRRKR